MGLFSNILLMVHLLAMCIGLGIGISTAVASAQIDDVQSEVGKAILGITKKTAWTWQDGDRVALGDGRRNGAD